MTKNRPAIASRIEAHVPKQPNSSALGGPAWRPDASVTWPVDRRGIVMMHLARINFSELPLFGGFPQSGLLQIFISTESITLGAGQAQGEGFVIEYWPDTKPGISVPQPELDDDNFEETPLVDGTPEDTMHDNGRSLSFTTVQMAEDEDGSQRPEVWLGGWPLSVQESAANDGDIVLLQIGNGECGESEFMWGGDIGAATFRISPADLAANHFDRVHYDASGY